MAVDELGWTIGELASLTGHSVRTIRYYATQGLLPPPVKSGRVAYYGADQRARLDLITALQEHGFTLQAIERYLSTVTDDVTVQDLAVRRALITSWTSESPDDVQARIGRELLALGLPRDALAAAYEATSRHMAALADDLNDIMRTRIVDAFRVTHHTPEEAEHLEKALPRLRELTVEAVVVSFQDAVNRVINRAMHHDR